MKRSEAIKLRALIEQSVQSLPDKQALQGIRLHPEWQPDAAYPAGHKVQRNGKLCRCLQAHTSQDGWEPENAPSLWEYINEVYAGDLYDPIPYEGNMELTEGLYYRQSGVTYLCTRSTGQPVYNALCELVGLYVKVAE